MGNETGNFVMKKNLFDQSYNNPLMNCNFCMKRSRPSCDNNTLSHTAAKQNHFFMLFNVGSIHKMKISQYHFNRGKGAASFDCQI